MADSNTSAQTFSKERRMCSFLQLQFDYEDLIRTIYTRNGQIYAGISHRSSGFVSRRVDWRFMVDKMELEEDFVGTLRFSPVSIISTIFHTQSIHLFILHSFIHSIVGHKRCLILYRVSDTRPICFHNTNPQYIEYK